MGWPEQDNLRYVGRTDDILIAPSQPHEVAYTVKDYLETNGYAHTPENKKLVRDTLLRYPGRTPWVRIEVEKWLNVQFGKK